VPLVFVIAGLAVVLLVALLAVGRMGALPSASPDLAPLNLPQDRELRAADVTGVRFAVGLRGYRMDQVDIVLERLAVDVHEKDARIALLERQLGSGPEPSRSVDLPTAPPPIGPPVQAPVPGSALPEHALPEPTATQPAGAEPTATEPAESFPPTPDDAGGPVR
jgi:DivIVA domain-containing protein